MCIIVLYIHVYNSTVQYPLFTPPDYDSLHTHIRTMLLVLLTNSTAKPN